MPIELKSMRRAKRLGKLLDCRAVDVFNASALAADGMMMMVRRLTQHEGRLAVGICALRHLALCTQSVERAINRRKRDVAAGALQTHKNLCRR